MWRLSHGVNAPNISTLQRLEAALAAILAEREHGDLGESMDGDAASALASAGWGTDEDYGGGIDRL